MYKEVKSICMIVLLVCGILSGCSDSSTVALHKDSTKEKSSVEETSEKKVSRIIVFVCGQVKKPGVYELNSDDRVVAAIEAAGGLTKKASIESVNQAQTMKDGEQIYIPSISGGKSSEGTVQAAETDTSKVNLNTATKEELMTLTGIGEAKAEDIIDYRSEKGSFQKPEDIMEIQGIKEGVYGKIKDKITV